MHVSRIVLIILCFTFNKLSAATSSPSDPKWSALLCTLSVLIALLPVSAALLSAVFTAQPVCCLCLALSPSRLFCPFGSFLLSRGNIQYLSPSFCTHRLLLVIRVCLFVFCLCDPSVSVCARKKESFVVCALKVRRAPPSHFSLAASLLSLSHPYPCAFRAIMHTAHFNCVSGKMGEQG